MDIVKSFAVKNVFFSGCQQVCDKPEKNESFRYINVSPVRCLSIFVADIYEIKVFSHSLSAVSMAAFWSRKNQSKMHAFKSQFTETIFDMPHVAKGPEIL